MRVSQVHNINQITTINIGNLSAIFLVSIGCFISILPIAPMFPMADLDSAWMYALNEAVTQHLVFGRDLIFTFGPYASIYTLSYHPGTDGLAMIAGLVLAIALATGLVVLAPGRRIWLAVFIAATLGLFAQASVPRDALFYVTPLVLLAVTTKFVGSGRTGSNKLLLSGAFLIVALSLIVLVKGSLAAGAVLSLGISGLLLLISRHWLLASCAVILFFLAIVAFWLISGQPLWALPVYFISQAPIISGYTNAMSSGGPYWQYVFFAVVVLIVIGLNVSSSIAAGLSGSALLVGMAILTGLVFKAGFVREDNHVIIAGSTLALMAGVLALANRGRAPMIGFLAGLCAWGVLEHAVDGLSPGTAFARLQRVYTHAGTGAVDRLRGGPALHKDFANALALIRAKHPLPHLDGSTDIYSFGQSTLLAEGLTWSPRPVLQSYSAYTPELEEKNAAHLSGAGAPKNVIIALEPIDTRLPALEDGLSWISLLNEYEPVSIRGDAAILSRLPIGTPPQSLSLVQPAGVGHLNQPTVLDPTETPLWSAIDVQPTLLGRAMAALFKVPSLNMAVLLQSGRTHNFRFIPGMGKSGFILSPLITDIAGLLALQLPGGTIFGEDRVVAFTIEGNERFWRGNYQFTLSSLQVSSRPHTRSILFNVPKPDVTKGDSVPCSLVSQDGRPLISGDTLTATKLVRFTGWSDAKSANNIKPGTITVWLQDSSGLVLSVPAIVQTRPDVALAARPSPTSVVFQALLDLSGLSGVFTIGVDMESDGHDWTCKTSSVLNVIKP